MHEGGSPTLCDGFFEYVDSNSVPVMGICYGMQLLVHHLPGGRVEAGKEGGEYGRMPITIEPGSLLFKEESTNTQVRCSSDSHA